MLRAHSMISEIQIGNFKAFGAKQTIPLRPITLVFGPNSAGKSSIIQSLLLARHIYDTGKPDAHQTTLGGAAVDLGGFGRYVHQHQADRNTTIRLAFKRADICGRFNYLNFDSLTLDYEIGVQDSKTAQHAIIKSVTLSIDSGELLRLVWNNDGIFQLDKESFESRSWLPEIDWEAQMEKQWASTNAKEKSRVSDAKKLVKIAREAGLSIDALFNPVSGQPTTKGHLILQSRVLSAKRKAEGLGEIGLGYPLRNHPEAEEDGASRAAVIFEFSSAKFRVTNLLLANLDPLPRENRDLQALAEMDAQVEQDPILFYSRLLGDGSPIETVCASALRYDVECLIEAANSAISREIGRISYLGPLRWIPPRFIPSGEQFDASWTAGGGEAWQRLRREPELMNRVNHFLQDTMRSGYQMMSQEFTMVKPTLDAQRSPLDEEKITTLLIVDACSAITVSHRDVGTGISQLLPVLVNAAGSKEHLIVIEQPELHLHPALQAELGDVFIESALGTSKNTFLIETHSEHLILRLLRRIRETADLDVQSDKLAIRPEDVAVLYVKPGREGSEVIELPVNTSGDFDMPWPDGFFAERAKELF